MVLRALIASVLLFSATTKSDILTGLINRNGDTAKITAERLSRYPTPPEPRHSNGSFLAGLNSHLSYLWNDNATSVRVVAASTGSWPPNKSEDGTTCTTPRLWLLIYGHYRSMWTTEGYFKKMAETSVGGDCYFVAAAMPPEVDSRKDNWGEYMRLMSKRGWPKNERLDAGSGVPLFLSKSALAGRLAYAVIERHGHIDKLPSALMLYWHAVWTVAKAAAFNHGFQINGDAVLIRTRADIMLRVPQSLTRFESYIKNGARGKHIVLGNEPMGNQGDIIMTTSCSCYETDVVEPIEKGLLRMRQLETPTQAAVKHHSHHAISYHVLLAIGMINGWGFGRSIRLFNHLWRGIEQLFDSCICLDGSLDCATPTCLVTTVESGASYSNKWIIRVRIERHRNTKMLLSGIAQDASVVFNSSMFLDPTEKVHTYCPLKSIINSRVERGFAPVTKPCFDVATLDLIWREKCAFMRSIEPEKLEGVWPDWCEITRLQYDEKVVQLNYSALAHPQGRGFWWPSKPATTTPKGRRRLAASYSAAAPTSPAKVH